MTTATTTTHGITLYDADAWSYGDGWEYVKRSIAERYVDDDFIADNYPDGTDFDDAIERECECLDDYTVWEEVAWYQQADLDNAISEVEQQVGDEDTIIFTGLLGLWNGIHRGGGTADSFADAIRKLQGRDCEVQTIEVIDGEVHVTLIHHDGTNSFTVRALTYEGRDAFEEWDAYYDDCPLAGMSEAEAYEALMTSPAYSHSIAPEW